MKLTKGFWKYSTTLLVVAVLLIIIGSISIARTVGSRETIFNATSAKENIARLSDENVALKGDIATYQKDIAGKELVIASLSAENETLKNFLLVGQMLEAEEMDGIETAFASVNPELLPESCRTQYEAYAERIKQHAVGKEEE